MDAESILNRRNSTRYSLWLPLVGRDSRYRLGIWGSSTQTFYIFNSFYLKHVSHVLFHFTF